MEEDYASSSDDDQLAKLLAKAGLTHLYSAFFQEKVTVDLIPCLSSSDFEKLGVTHVGERLILLNLAKNFHREGKVGEEMRQLFTSSRASGSRGNTSVGVSSSSPTISRSNAASLLTRADDLCKRMRMNRKSRSTCHTTRRTGKEVQKGLILINYSSERDAPLREVDKIYDGYVRFFTGMSEEDVRTEIVRLISQKTSANHNLSLIQAADFDFVRYVNRRVKAIDGDIPFDGNGVCQVYKGGAIYVQLNSRALCFTFSPQPSSSEDELPSVKFKKPVHTSSDEGPSASTVPASSPGSSCQNPIVVMSEVLGSPSEKVIVGEPLPSTVGDIVKKLMTVISKSESFEFVVTRENILEDALKELDDNYFDPSKKFSVYFLGESGYDQGGLTREFFTTFFCHASMAYMECTGCFRHDSLALQTGVYFKLGQLAAMALVHGGGALKLFSPSVFSCLGGQKLTEIDVQPEEVSETQVRDLLQKILSASDVEDFRRVLQEGYEIIAECGVAKPLDKLTDKRSLIRSIGLHHVILKSLGEIEQFREGLDTLGVMSAVKEHPKLLAEFYVRRDKKVTARDVLRMFKDVKFSESGTNAREREGKTYMWFKNYLLECERGNIENEPDHVSLEQVMLFFSGAGDVPPLGYSFSPTLNFNPINPYQSASTCALTLTLPTKYSKYDEFKEALDVGFTMNGGFGLH